MRQPGTKVTFALAVVIAGALLYTQAIGAVLEDGGPAFLAAAASGDAASGDAASGDAASGDAASGDAASGDAAGPSATAGLSDFSPSAGSGAAGALDSAGGVGGAGTPAPSAAGSTSAGSPESRPTAGTGATPSGSGGTAPPASPDGGPGPALSGEPLVVVTPAILALKALSGGVPSIIQVAGSLVVARLPDLLPAEIVGPILDGYQQGVDAVTAGQAAAADLLTGVADATLPLGSLLNPTLRPLGVALIEAVAVSLENSAGLVAGIGLDVSFATYAAEALRSTAAAFGLA